MNNSKEEALEKAKINSQKIENKVDMIQKEKSAFIKLSKDTENMNCNLNNKIGNLEQMNIYLREELEMKEMKLEQLQDWLDNAKHAFGKIFSNTYTNCNSILEKNIILTSAFNQEMELQLIADNLYFMLS